jgi:hypothetical protein
MSPSNSTARSSTNLVTCTACPWRGVPTYIKARPQSECPACRCRVVSVDSVAPKSGTGATANRPAPEYLQTEDA